MSQTINVNSVIYKYKTQHCGKLICTFRKLFLFWAKFWHFCRNTPEESVKNTIHGIIFTSEFLYIVTNHATDGAVVH